MGGYGGNGRVESEEEEAGQGGGRRKLPAVPLFPGGERIYKRRGACRVSQGLSCVREGRQ